MRPAKTDQAREALRTRAAGLGAIERHVLIVSNGERTREEIAGMLGDAARVALDRLYRDGFLRDADTHAQTATAVATTLPACAPEAAGGAGIGAAASRRSIVAAKLYMLDMLQLQRGAGSDAIGAELRASREPADVARGLAAALDHLRRVAAPTYSARVAERLAEVAPPELLESVKAFTPEADACAA